MPPDGYNASRILADIAGGTGKQMQELIFAERQSCPTQASTVSGVCSTSPFSRCVAPAARRFGSVCVLRLYSQFPPFLFYIGTGLRRPDCLKGSIGEASYFGFPCCPPHCSKPFRSHQIAQTSRPAPVFAYFDKTLADTEARESGHAAPACTNYVSDELPASGNRYLIPVHSA